MFEILKDKTICLTRGDVAGINVFAKLKGTGESHTFTKGDVIRFTVTQKGDCSDVKMQKEATVESEVESITVRLESADSRFDDPINKPTDYWYEIELNPDTSCQTLVGYDKEGPKVFRLFPEGGAHK